LIKLLFAPSALLFLAALGTSDVTGTTRLC